MFDNLKQRFKRTAKRVTGRELKATDVEDILWDLRIQLLESDVAVSVADRIMRDVEKEFEGEKGSLGADARSRLFEILEESIREILSPEEATDFIETIEENVEGGEPAVLVFVGVNGCGKTTTIAKIVKYLKERDYRPVLAASDTFRAAGIEQLEEHGDNLGVRVIKHERGADAAAVAYDAVEHAKAQDLDVVLVDTAGRMQTDANLMDEMKKICRVSNPDLTIFVGDALTGNDAVEQASKFEETVEIDGSILTKMDADASGGATLSIVHETGKPILFLGTGQGYEDLVEFDPEIIVDNIIPDY
ncbi:MAG: signal recognition particle-docking protein FtsY [Candidatus Hadarchaeia archaeon]